MRRNEAYPLSQPGPAVPTPSLKDLALIRRLVGSCHERMGDPLSWADLEDVVQNVAIKCWQNTAPFRGESSEETWIYGIARLTILEQLRTRRRHNQRRVSGLDGSELDTEEEAPSPDEVAGGTGLARAVEAGLRSAGTTVARIFRAHEVEGMTFAEIGSRLRMSESSAKSRYHRALPRLRERLRTLWHVVGERR